MLIREEKSLERFRRRNSSAPFSEKLDRRLVLPLTEFIHYDRFDINGLILPSPESSRSSVDSLLPVFRSAAVRAYMDSVLSRFVPPEGSLRAAEKAHEFHISGSMAPVVFHSGNSRPGRKCEGAEEAYGLPVFCCMVKASSGAEGQPLIYPDMVAGKYESRLIWLPDPGRFDELAMEAITRRAGPDLAHDAADELLFHPLGRFLSSPPVIAELEAELAVTLGPALEARGRDLSSYVGFAMESYIRMRLAEFSEGSASFSLYGARAGALPNGITFIGDGMGGLTFFGIREGKVRSLAEIDAVGIFSYEETIRPVIFEIKSKPFCRLFGQKKHRIFKKNSRRAKLVSELFRADPYVCIICPDERLSLKAGLRSRVLSVPGLEEVKDLARRLWAENELPEG
ncbi:MAG: hypothetical protein AB1324_04730 [Candidatus Micrarchaeota archaeon]